MSDTLTFEDLVNSLERKCSVRRIESDIQLVSVGVTTELALVEFNDSRTGGLHLIQTGLEKPIWNQETRNQALHQTKLSDLVPRIVNRARVSVLGSSMVIYELEGCSSPNLRTLTSYLEDDESDVRTISAIMAAIAHSLYSCNIETMSSPSNWLKDDMHALFQKWTSNNLLSPQAPSSMLEYLNVRLPSVTSGEITQADSLVFDESPQIIPNPVAWLMRPDSSSLNSLVVWPSGHQLGNLAADNLIISSRSHGLPYLLSCDSYTQDSVFFDWFYFELDMLLHYLRLESVVGWREFVSLTRGLTSGVELSSSNRPPGDRAALAWDILIPYRSMLHSLINTTPDSSNLRGDFQRAAWLSAASAGLQIALEARVPRTEYQRKAAMLYAGSALAQLLERRARSDGTTSEEKVIQIRRTGREAPLVLSLSELDTYFSWVIQEGGATKHVIAGLEDWFVEPVARLSPVSIVRHYDDNWLTGLEQQWGSGIHPEKRERLKGLEDLKALIDEHHRIVVLGEPGSGKTTLLERLFLDYVSRTRSDSSTIPVLVRLQSFSGESSFEDYVLQQLGGLAKYFPLIKHRLLLLCDSLNEMPFVGSAPDRRDLVHELRTYLENTNITWIMTCRVRDYVSQNLSQVGRGVKRIEIMPLDIPQIQEMIQRRFRRLPSLAVGLWEELCGGSQNAPIVAQMWSKFTQHNQEARFWEWQSSRATLSLSTLPQYINSKDEENAWRAMHERHIMRLCRNPYMLKLIAQVYVTSVKEGHALPNSQGQIFHTVITNMINNERARCTQRGEVWADDLEINIMKALRIIAFAMQAHGITRQTETEISKQDATNALAEDRLEDPGNLIELASSAQILVCDEQKIRFSHQLMQEYFASLTLITALQSDDPETYWPQKIWWEPGQLDETVVILVGWYTEWPSVIQWIAKANPELAVECLTRNGRDATDLDSITHNLLRAAIQQKIDNGQSKVERAAAYRALGWFGDIRPGVEAADNGVPDIAWSDPIEAGKFLMGGDPEALGSWEGLNHNLPYTYYMAKYPVTVAQYRRFVQDGGYTEKWKNCWTPLGWKWVAKGSKAQPYAWNNLRWIVPNHPVIGVTWHEAYAFSKWLHYKLRAAGKLPSDRLTVRLPTEAEWEKAARGVGGQIFTWGMTFDTNCGNFKEGYDFIGRTSAVGLFGASSASPYGVEDMCGNVWEWCLSDWQAQYDADEPVRLDVDAAKSCRGGSWYHDSKNARAASRFWYRPTVADFCWGFRVCLSIDL